MQYTSEQAREAFKKLPPALQEAITSIEMAEVLQRIGQKHNLHIDQMGGLGGEVGYVLLGLEPSANFVANIRDRLQIDQATADSVAADCNNEIFVKIRESLKQLEENQNTPQPEELLYQLERPIEHLSDVQHPSPVAIPPLTIFERKLNETVNFKPTENQPPVSAEPPITKVDPYHEPIEP